MLLGISGGRRAQYNLLVALGVGVQILAKLIDWNVGEHVARLLEKYYKSSVDKFRIASNNELELIEGIGPIVAREIVVFWSNQANLEMVEMDE